LNLPGSIQTSFLEQIKQGLSPNLSLADELAEVLNLSRDSAYRRIRGETILSLDEVKTLCNHYGVSLDALVSPSSEMVSFRHRMVNHMDFPFGHWLKYLHENLKMISSFPEKELIYSAKDILIFYLFKLPDLSAFKMFFWMKTVVGNPEYAHEKFDPALVPKDFLALGERIWEKYADLPSTEIWSDEAISATLRQIAFYWDCNLFVSSGQAQAVCDQLLHLMDQIQQHATRGKRSAEGTFKLYRNEILIADNTVLFKMGDKRVTFVTYNTFNFLSTTQESFCLQTEAYLQNLINKSTLISGTGEKDRSKFFNSMNEKIRDLKGRLK